MKAYQSLHEHGDACRTLRDLGANSASRSIEQGVCPGIKYKDTSPSHCIHTFLDTTQVCCGCEKVFSESPTKIREREIRFQQLEDEGL